MSELSNKLSDKDKENINRAAEILRAHNCTEETIKTLLTPQPFGIGEEQIDCSEDAIWNAKFVLEQEQEGKLDKYEWGDYKKEVRFIIMASYAFD